MYQIALMPETKNRPGDGTARTCVLVVLRVALLALFASGCAEGTTFLGPIPADAESLEPGGTPVDAGPDAMPADLCATAVENTPYFNESFLDRQPLVIENNSNAPMELGTPIRIVLDHAALVAAGVSLENGDDVRVVFFDGETNIELERVSENGFNRADTEILFPLAQELAAGANTATYWIYSNNLGVTSPGLVYLPLPLVMRSIDESASLGCMQRAASFRSIQLRQTGTTSYQVFNREHTGDSTSFGRIHVTDTANGDIIFSRRYDELGGTCCSPVVDGYATDTFTTTAQNLTVELESNEFSGSCRLFGCQSFCTRHPDSRETTIRSYRMVPTPPTVLASPCDL